MRTSEAGGGEQPLFERRPRVAEVAARAGVSTATVDRVINARGGVRKKTVALVEKAIREMVAVDRSRPAHAAAFDIFLPANSGRSTEVLAEALTRAGNSRGAQANIVSVERMNPAALAHQLMDCAQRGSSGVAFQALDHQLVREAVNELVRAGIPVVTLCSDIGDVERLAYIGVDNRAAGRTAGFLMGRFCRGPGKLAVVWGGQLYRSHEEREIGFRTVLRQDFSALQIIEAVNGNDDPSLNFACVSDLIDRHPDLVGVYCVGGGQGAVAAAIEFRRTRAEARHDRPQLQRRDQALRAIGNDRCDHPSGYDAHRGSRTELPDRGERLAGQCRHPDRDHHAREPDAPLVW